MTIICVTIERESLKLPIELYAAMERPDKLMAIPEDAPNLFLRDHRSLTYFKSRIKQLLSRGLQKRSGQRIYSYSRASQPEGDFVIYKTREKPPLPESREYRIVNYHPNYYLMPADNAKEEKSREQFWHQIQNYHEHRDLPSQDTSAHQNSQWLARDVFQSLGAKSFLEIGCGSGRNLFWIHKLIPDAALYGVDINVEAVAKTRELLTISNISTGSLYDLSRYKEGQIDVVYTSGVLMHVPHEAIEQAVREMNRIASVAVVHFELHGPSHQFDYHRYPRDYEKLYQKLRLGYPTSYEVYPHNDFRSQNMSLHMALLVSRKKGGTNGSGVNH